jgi:hypothetical protein
MALTFLFLVFFSCSTPTTWRSEQIEARSREHRATRFLYRPDDPMANVNVQILQGSYGVRFSLHLLSRPLLPAERQLGQMEITLGIKDKNEQIRVQRVEGGQVLVLPEPTGKYLLNLLLQGESLELKLPRYQTIIPPIDVDI